jgi:type IV secretion system protein VirB4
MALLYKAMTRPAMFLGVPATPMLATLGGIFLVSVYVSKLLLLLAPIAWLLLKAAASQDEHIFSLWGLKLRTRGNPKANRHYEANAISASHYDPVNIEEFLDTMKLSDRAPLENIIPYSSHVDTSTVKTKEGDYITTWQVMGSQFECESHRDLAFIDEQLATLIRGFSNKPVTFYVHSVRESFFDGFGATSSNPFADEVVTRYEEAIRSNQFKGNKLYFTLVYRPDGDGMMNKAERKSLSLEEKKNNIERHVTTMQGFHSMMDAALNKFTAKRLGMQEKKGVTFSSQLSFYHYLLTGTRQPIRVTNAPIYRYLGNADIFFGNDTGQVKPPLSQGRFFRSIEIKEFIPETGGGHLDALFYVNADYVVTHSFTVLGKGEALKRIKQAKKQLISTEDDGVSQIAQLDEALDQVVSGDVSFGMYHMTVMVFADTKEELEASTAEVMAVFSDAGFVSVLSTLSLPAAFCAQLPGVVHLRPRLAPISNRNFVELASLHNVYQGKRDLNCWGEALGVFKTPSGQAHYLNLHHANLFTDETGEKNLANTKIIGGTGSGKTMLLSFLSCLLQKYSNPLSFAPDAKVKRLTTVFLDKDRGAELCVRALGGEYYRVKTGEPTGWNPFSLPNNKRNRQFLKSLMKILCERTGEKLSSSEEVRINEAVEAVMAMPDEMRHHGISRLLEHLTQSATREARENGIMLRLSQWAQGGQFGWVFDNAEDTFHIGEVNNFGIDGTEFLDDADVCTAISFYLLYRITQLLDGRRLVIFIDEFWKWLKDEAFSDFVYNKLKTIRKLNGLVLPATQSPDEILKHPIARAVVESCATGIYLSNKEADRGDYVDGLKVSEQDFEIVKGLTPTSRQFLVKKGGLIKGDSQSFSALATLDLSGLGKYTKILSASEDNLSIFDDIYRPGMKPHEWIDTYLAKAV